MNPEIFDTPFRVELVGKRGKVANRCYGEVGKRLMDAMWSDVRRIGMKSTGINHWVYLAEDEMFTGVELAAPANDLGSLEPLSVELKRYLRYLHKGPYTELSVVWPKLCEHLRVLGEKQIFPGLEIYGHWNEGPSQLETTILIALAGKGKADGRV